MQDQQLLTQVNEFYDSAWNKLIIVGTIALTIVGIIAPLLIQWYQKKSLILSETRLRDSFRKEMDDFKRELKAELHDGFSNELKIVQKNLEIKIQKVHYYVEGGLFHFQGNDELNDREYSGALRSYSLAINFYLAADNYEHFSVLLDVLNESLSKVKSSDLQNLKIQESIDLEQLLEKVSQKDQHGVFRSIIIEMKMKIKGMQ